jgi:undecaprenyl-diphosphatase
MNGLNQLDAALFEIINRGFNTLWLDELMIFASSKYGWTPLYLFLVWVFFAKFPWKKAVLFVLMLLSAFGISDSFTSRVVKPWFKRPRPYTEQTLNARLPHINGEKREKFIHDNLRNYGFVSSHAANFFAFTTLALILLGWKDWRYWALFAAAVLVALSRVYLGVHYPGDVLGGAITGVLIAHFLAFLYRYFLLPKLWAHDDR